MKRLTRKSDSGMVWFVDHENNNIELEPCEMNSHHNRLAIQKLAVYEDAEEQGLFLRSPCKVGDKAYVIDNDSETGKLKVYEGIWERVTLVQSVGNNVFELHGHIIYDVYDFFYDDGRTMKCGMYVGQPYTKFGEVVFLTKEEAEQALTKINSK